MVRLWKYAAVVMMVMILGVGEMWGWSTNVYLNGNFTGNNWNQATYQFTWWYNSTDGKFYISVYATGSTQYFRLWTNNHVGPSTNNTAITTSGSQANSYSENNWKYTGNAGIINICVDQTDGKDWNPWVWYERPTVKFKHPWGGSSWTDVSATDNNDGTYQYKGNYGGTEGFDALISGDDKYNTSSTTVTGSPASGDRCLFKWNASGYQHATGKGSNTGTFTITKLCAITYDGNDKTSGTLPLDQSDIIYNTSTTVRGNTGSLAKTGYNTLAYWNSAADGSGTDYAIGSGSLSPTASTTTLYAKWTQSIVLDREGGTTGDESLNATYKAVLSTGSLTLPTRAGYDFAGYWTGDDGTGSMVIDANGNVQTVASWTDSDNKWIHDGSSTLYAKWTPVALTFKADASTSVWGTASNWDPACVPTSGHDITIKKAVTVSGTAAAKSIAFDGGSLTITSTGALEVAGTITNDDPEKIVVQSRGALIYSGSTSAEVQLSMSSGWHLVALPVAGVSVSSAFAGKGVYTYAWDNTKKAWERRGYYDDLMGNEAILVMGSTGYTFSGALVSTGDGGGTLTYDGTKANGDVNMFGNNLTAPIKVSGMTISGSPDGAVHVFNGAGWTGLLSSEVIPAMQGYAILASSGGGSFSYSYATAVRGATNPNAALRAPQRTTSDRLDYITIYVSGNEWKNRICLSEDEQFTDEIDMGYEALHMEGEGIAGELYAQAEKKMNVLAAPDLEGTVVGFVPGEATNYTISFEGDGRGYYLNDIKMEQSTLIEEGNTYEFTPDESTNATRFVISKTPIHKVPTSVDAISNGSKARKQLINGILYVIRDGKIYDTCGNVVK